MGLFSDRMNRPGPGVRKDEPRKKGLARFFELIGRDAAPFFKANFLCTLAIIPAAFLVSFGLFSHSLIFTLGGGLIGGAIFGPFYAGMHDTVLRSLRDEPGYWWHTYKRAMKNNWKQAILLGVITGGLISTQLLSVWSLLIGGMKLTALMAAMMILNVLVTGMASPFLWAQMVLMSMSTPMLIKNSIFLALSNAPRAILMAVLQTAYWGVILLFMPLTGLPVLVFGFALMVIITMMISMPPMDKVFHLEEQFAARREALMAEGEQSED